MVPTVVTRALLATAIILSSPDRVIAAPFVNGSFESGSDTGPLGIVLPNGSTAITGWLVGGSGVDWLTSAAFSPSDGDRTIDLNASQPGSVLQIFDTVPGRQYVVTFDLSGNPQGLPLVKEVQVTVGPVSQTFSFDIGSVLPEFYPVSLTYVAEEVSFIAVDTSTTLTFTSLSGASAYGPVIDNISLPGGGSQENPVVPLPQTECGECAFQCPICTNLTRPCFVFCDEPSDNWFDPPMAFGYEYEMDTNLDPNSVFTDVLDFPTGFADPFTVMVDGTPLGSFGPGESVSFGAGVSKFSITGISPLVDPNDPVAFPVKLSFGAPTASFTMIPLLADGVCPDLVFQHQGSADPEDPNDGGWQKAGLTASQPVFDSICGLDARTVGANSGPPGDLVFYIQDPNDAVVDAGNALGWTYQARLRLLDPNDQADAGVGMSYWDGFVLWELHLGTQADSDPIVLLRGDQGGPGPDPGFEQGLEGLGAGCHFYEMVYDPNSSTIDLFVDGSLILPDYAGGSDDSLIPGSSPPRLWWGNGGNAGFANWELVQFIVGPPCCGDGVASESSEECDDGNTNAGDGCSAICVAELCGDGIINDSPNEQCDDGGTANGDGCSSVCQFESNPPDKDQQRCISALNKDLGKVVKAIGREAFQCIKNGAKGNTTKLGPGGTIESCIDDDLRGKLAKAKARTLDDAEKRCMGVGSPDFGPTDPNAINEVGVQAVLNLLRMIFGANLDTSILPKADPTKPASKCQQGVVKTAKKCLDTKLKTFLGCKRVDMKDALIGTPLDLQACMDSDPKNKIKKDCDPATGKIRSIINKKCGAPVDMSTAFPGCGTADPATLAACLDQIVGCRVCLALNAADNLSLDCDEFDDGTLDRSCP